MKEIKYTLGVSTGAEPLVNSWAAWSHLISPIPASLHLKNYQLKLLESYLADPQVHENACRNPKLRSGRFVDIPAARADEVRRLLASTESKQRPNLELAESVIDFHNYIVEEASGQSLEPFYERVPPALRGYVELVYDYYNRPTVRFFESLLYESPFYNKGLQSLRLFRQSRDDSRAFIMNTPRLPEPAQIDWVIPFESELLDEFFRLERYPQPLGYVRELLNLNGRQDEVLLPLLTEADEPVRPAAEWAGSTLRLRYIGHACVFIEWNGVSILTDPYIGVVPSEGGEERFTYADLPEKIDYVLITHNHHDHFCLETLLRLRRRVGCLVVPRSNGIVYGDLSLKTLALKLGFRQVVEMETLESIPLPDGEIVAVPFMGEHADLPHGKTAYVVRAGREQILFAADSDCLDRRVYEHIRQVLGPIETVFLGMECVGAPLSWSCGPFFPRKPDASHERSRRYKGCDSERALNIHETVGARRIFVYAMGMEPWLEHLLGLAYTEESLQLAEARRLLSRAREKSFDEATLLYGKYETEFDVESEGEVGGVENAAGRAAPSDAESQFRF